MNYIDIEYFFEKWEKHRRFAEKYDIFKWKRQIWSECVDLVEAKHLVEANLKDKNK